jgi:lipopolysaccharide export system protein LptC
VSAGVISKVAKQHVRPMHLAGDPAEPQGRVETAFRQARRHSSFVRVLKFGLPAAAVAMMVAFAGQSWLSSAIPESVEIGGAAIEDGRLVMADPKLAGFTKEDRAYTMTANRAIQDIGSADRVDLEGIKAKLPFDDESWIHVRAPTGTFDRTANTLDIDSDVTVKTDTGITARLKSAMVDIGAGNLDTADPVDITMDGTHVVADSLSVREKGKVMLFQNRVRVVIDAKRLQTASTADGAQNEN